MGIWYKECFPCRSGIKCYVEIQNDWTGVTLNQVRDIKSDKNGKYYIRCDGQLVDVTYEYNKVLANIEKLQKANSLLSRYNLD